MRTWCLLKDLERALSYLAAIEENQTLARKLATTNPEEFASDPFQILAAEALFIRCGELAKRLARLFPEHFSGPPWRMLAQNRDKVAHDYLALDHDMLLRTMTQDLPLVWSELDSARKMLKLAKNASR